MEIKNILVVDIETTGFLNNGGKIVEVGIALLNLNTGNTIPIYDELVKEEGYSDLHKNSWIFNNSDLKHENVMSARPLDIQKIQKILDLYPATAYNKRFDFDFFYSRGLRVNELDCPMILSTQICKIPFVNRSGFKWPKVQEAYDFFFGQTDYIEKHRGCDDAIHEAQIVYELYRRGVFKFHISKNV